MRTFDKYELEAIQSALPTIQEYAILKTCQPVPNVCKLIKKGKREFLSIAYLRCGDFYFLELSLRDCTELMKQ